ncbi:MAG: hypothetical protein ACR2J8_06530, partial [Thermomicrobiales bacterium]
VLNGTDKGTRAIMTANPALRWLRDRAISAVSNIPAVQGALTERISELGLAYRDSSLTGPANRAGFDPGAPRPGDRAPQADLYPLAGDVPATLFDAYGRGGFTLLLFPDPTHLAASLRDAATIGAWVRERLGSDCLPLLVTPATQSDLNVPIPAAHDKDGGIRRLFGARGEAAVLVRPDGYIASRTTPISHTAIWQSFGAFFNAALLPDGPIVGG